MLMILMLLVGLIEFTPRQTSHFALTQKILSTYTCDLRKEVISLSNFIQITPTTGAQTISHYNLFRSIEINGNAAPGYSSGQAIAAMERLAAEILPNKTTFEWSGISLEEIRSQGQAPLILRWDWFCFSRAGSPV